MEAMGSCAGVMHDHTVDGVHAGKTQGDGRIVADARGGSIDDGPGVAIEQVVWSPDLNTPLRRGLAARIIT